MVGRLNGAATDAAGTVTQVTDQAFTTTAAFGPGGVRNILFLDLGPIFLDVNTVPGAGNLLCAITGLAAR